MDDLDRVRDDLDQFITDGLDMPSDLDDAEPAQLEDQAQANRMLRAVAAIDREVARVHAVADDEVRAIRAWAEDLLAGRLRQREWIVRSLEGWMMGQPAEVRTVKLPHGELRRRPLKQRVEVLDDTEPAVAEVAAVAPQIIKTTRTVSRTFVTAELTVGQPIDGAVADPGYALHEAVLIDPETSEVTVVPHVVFVVPLDGADAFGFTAR